jgi:hypothetical protein
VNIHAQRLLNVARALRESLIPDHFDMGIYAHHCGTPACAIGHYASRTDLQDLLFLSKGGNLCSATTRDSIDYYEAWVLQHFGITDEQSDELFSPQGCGNAETPNQAADFIEAFVAEKWPGSVLDPTYVKLKGDLNIAAAVRMLEHS